MITFTKGDIFATKCETLVCPVNVVGVMGAGLARDCARRWPQLARAYKSACRSGELRIGQCWTYEVAPALVRMLVVCFPTKGDWRRPSDLYYIDRGLASLVEVIKRERIASIAVPALGCGLGGLAWSEVRPRIERALAGLECEVEIYEP